MLKPGLYEKSIPSKKQKNYSSSTNRNQQSNKGQLSTSVVKTAKQPDTKLTNICTDQTKIFKNFDNSIVSTQRVGKPIIYKNTYVNSAQVSRQASLTKSFVDQSESRDSIGFSKLNSSQIKYESNRKLNESSNILPETKEKIIFSNSIKPINPSTVKPKVVRLTKQKKCESVNMNSSTNPIKKINPSEPSIYNRSVSRGIYSGKNCISVEKSGKLNSQDKAQASPSPNINNDDLSKNNTNTPINININNFNQKNYHVPMIKGPNVYSAGQEIIECPEQQHYICVAAAKKNRFLAKQFDKVDSSDDMISF